MVKPITMTISMYFTKIGGKEFNEYMIKCMQEWFKTHELPNLPSRRRDS